MDTTPITLDGCPTGVAGNLESDSCCNPNLDADRTPCPECGEVGPIVGHEPVRPHRIESEPGDWQYCPTANCAVAYYHRAETVTTDQLRTQVAHKGLDKSTPVCFCFSHTSDDITADLESNNGTSTIKAGIKAAVAGGFCACEHLNPSGTCCLADIHRLINAMMMQDLRSPT